MGSPLAGDVGRKSSENRCPEAIRKENDPNAVQGGRISLSYFNSIITHT